VSLLLRSIGGLRSVVSSSQQSAVLQTLRRSSGIVLVVLDRLDPESRIPNEIKINKGAELELQPIQSSVGVMTLSKSKALGHSLLTSNFKPSFCFLPMYFP
jgi:hypothetical protein